MDGLRVGDEECDDCNNQALERSSHLCLFFVLGPKSLNSRLQHDRTVWIVKVSAKPFHSRCAVKHTSVCFRRYEDRAHGSCHM